jgi:glycosyltransferase involved in cell wall biosynthesis
MFNGEPKESIIIMIYLAWFIVFFTLLQFFIALLNLIFRPRLHRYTGNSGLLLSILIPARNEENNIAELLNDLLTQSFSNFEAIVFDDDSSDRTAEVIREFMSNDHRIRLIQSKELPSGWLGKNYACHSLAREAKGEYLLFIDADVRIQRNLLQQVLNYARYRKLGLLSIFPVQKMVSIGERITVPVMNYILLTLLPLFLVRRSGFVSLSAANGQFMLFEGNSYRQIEPHLQMRDYRVEDIAISRLYKRKKIRIACLSGTDDISCRMYRGFHESVKGFSKNVVAFFGNSNILAVLLWAVTTFGFMVVLFCLQFKIFLIFIISYLITRILVSLVSHQKISTNLLLLLPQQLALGLIIYRSIYNTIRKEYIWKGRSI